MNFGDESFQSVTCIGTYDNLTRTTKRQNAHKSGACLFIQPGDHKAPRVPEPARASGINEIERILQMRFLAGCDKPALSVLCLS